MANQTNISTRKAISQENHTSEVIGDIPAWRRAEVEDDLVQACADACYGQTLKPFRNFLSKWAREVDWNENDYRLCSLNDRYCWGRVWSVCVYLRRLMPLYEFAANKLIREGMVDYRQLPPGTAFLGA